MQWLSYICLSIWGESKKKKKRSDDYCVKYDCLWGVHSSYISPESSSSLQPQLSVTCEGSSYRNSSMLGIFKICIKRKRRNHQWALNSKFSDNSIDSNVHSRKASKAQFWRRRIGLDIRKKKWDLMNKLLRWPTTLADVRPCLTPSIQLVQSEI